MDRDQIAVSCKAALELHKTPQVSLIGEKSILKACEECSNRVTTGPDLHNQRWAIFLQHPERTAENGLVVTFHVDLDDCRCSTELGKHDV